MKQKRLAIAFIAAALCVVTQANAAGNVGQCMTYKAKVAKDGRLIPVKQIVVKATPQDAVGTKPNLPLAMTVVAEQGKLVQVTNPETSQVIGWVSVKDMELQDLRNCN